MKHTILDLRIGDSRFSYDLQQYASGPEADPYSSLGEKNRTLLDEACKSISKICKDNGVNFNVRVTNQYCR